jgi:hypothetical protein
MCGILVVMMEAGGHFIFKTLMLRICCAAIVVSRKKKNKIAVVKCWKEEKMDSPDCGRIRGMRGMSGEKERGRERGGGRQGEVVWMGEVGG